MAITPSSTQKSEKLNREVLLRRLDVIGRRIGNTPCVPLAHDRLDLFVKLERGNFIGSIKDRAAYRILRRGIETGRITPDTILVESSSGNFALSCAAMCHVLGLRFVAVIDPNINRVYEELLMEFAHEIRRVTLRDETGGYIQEKWRIIEQIRRESPDVYWTDQYANPENLRAHYEGTGREIAEQFDDLDYVFLGVASAGTISGVSRRLHESFPDITVVAVDSVGSAIFGAPEPRHVPGMGSTVVPALLEQAIIDDVIRIDERDGVRGCHRLLREHALFVGGSTGSVFAALDPYFEANPAPGKPTVLFLAADGGIGYSANVFNAEWRDRLGFELDEAGVPSADE